MTDSLIGLSTKEFTLLCADANAGFSIIVMKDNEDKILEVDGNKILACNGENGDRVQFSEYIQKNLNLYRLTNLRPLSTKGAASFLRNELAYYLRRSPYMTNMLFGGYDKEVGASLYFVDYLASMQKVNFGAQGYGAYFTLALLDKEYNPNITIEEGIKILKKCIKEIQKRFVLNTPKFTCKVVDKKGIRIIEL